MIEADLCVTGISELVTPVGNGPRLGRDLGRVRVIEKAALAARDGVIVFAGTEREFRETVTPASGGQQIDAAGGTVLPGFVDAHTHLPFAG